MSVDLITVHIQPLRKMQRFEKLTDELNPCFLIKALGMSSNYGCPILCIRVDNPVYKV